VHYLQCTERGKPKDFSIPYKKKKPPAEIQKNKQKNVLVWATAHAVDGAAGRDQLSCSNKVRASFR
jgi:hypothetical protein